MLNKKLLNCVIGAALLSAAITANAASSGAFVGGQLGYGNIGQDWGYGNHPLSLVQDGYGTSSQSIDHLAGRIFGGYQFNPNLALELGWARFGNLNDKITLGSSDGVVSSSTILKTNVVDLLVKGSLPIADQISLYGKLGAAYVRESWEVSANGNYGRTVYRLNRSGNDHRVLPEASVGVSYAFTDNVAADVFYTRIQKVGNNSPIESINFAGVGLSYTFG